jgi:cbb3-type cytochrome oxidase maturation protein
VTVLFVVVPVALLLVLGAIAAYVAAARRGQFDDLVTPALRMLHDDPPARDVARGTAEAGTPSAGRDLSSPSSPIV